jgi:hypothetical protein
VCAKSRSSIGINYRDYATAHTNELCKTIPIQSKEVAFTANHGKELNRNDGEMSEIRHISYADPEPK